MERKLVLSLIACAGLSFTSATVALADDPAPNSSATTSTDTSSTTTPAPDPATQGTALVAAQVRTAATAPRSNTAKNKGRLARAAFLSAGQCRDRQHGT